METYLIFSLVGVFFFILHYMKLYGLNKHLSINHPEIWERLCIKSIFGIQKKNIPYYKEPSLGFNYFKVIKFVFSKEFSDDRVITNYRFKVKIFFFLYLFSWLVAFVYP
jgi:hypothetical protein